MPPQDQLPGAEKRSPLQLPNRIGDAAPERSANIWTKVRANVHKASGPHRPTYLGEMSSSTALLPFYWEKYPADLVMYLRREMFDTVMVNVLEHHEVINWCPSTVKLYPFIAPGDGNCLMHAVSLGLWGVEDATLMLRKLLYSVMKGEFAEANEERWRRERNRFDATIPCSGFRYNTKEWTAEWNIVINIASPERRADEDGLPYECLEEFHIFIIANILRRPIIVLAEDMWHDAHGQSLQPLNFSGIYLPLGWEGKDCHRYPLVLGYHQMHFAPLVCTMPMPDEDGLNRYVVPLVHRDLTELPVHFLTSREEGKVNDLLREYLYVEEVLHVTDDMESARTFPGARLDTRPPREELDVFDAYMKLAEPRYRIYVEEQHNPSNAKALKAAGVMAARSGQQLVDKMAQLNAGTEAGYGASEMPVTMATEDEGYSGVSRPVRTGSPSALPAGQTLHHDVLGAKPKAYSALSHVKVPLSKLSSNIPRGESLYSEQPIMSGVKQPQLECATPGCPYLQAVSTGQYCTQCFRRLRNQKGGNADVICLTEGCLNRGDLEYDGYCKVCHDQSKFMRGATREMASKKVPSSFDENSQGMVVRGPYHEPAQPGAQVDRNEMNRESTTLHTDLQQFEATTLNTGVINAMTVGRKKCISEDCDFTGHPSYSGLCSGCFRKDGYLDDESVIEPKGPESPKAVASARPSGVVGRKKCIMPECHLKGHPDKGEMCSGCFEKQTSLMKETGRAASPKLRVNTSGSRGQRESVSRQDLLSPTKLQERQKQIWNQAQVKQCKTLNCDMYGSPETNGYCSKCFQKSVEGPATQTKETRAQVSAAKVPQSHVVRHTYGNDLNFTVQKNMCATPGCLGVRLNMENNDLCRAHYQEMTRYSSGKCTPTPPTVNPSPAGVHQYSKVSMIGGRVQPTAPPPSVTSYQAGPDAWPLTSGSGEHAFKPASFRSLPRKSRPEEKNCTHPKCTNPALPPDYIACRDCTEFVEAYHRRLSANTLQSERRAAPPPETRDLSPIDDLVTMETTEDELNMDIEAAPKPQTAAQKKTTLPSRTLENKFQFEQIQRIKCQAMGGCPDKMYGDPSYGNLCSTCFDREIVAKHQTAPVKKSSRSVQSPKSRSDVITSSTRSSTSASKHSSRPSNYLKCATPDCTNQANTKISKGYCNDCYKVYRNIDTAEKKIHGSKPSQRSTSTSKRAPVEDKMFQVVAGKQPPACRKGDCPNFGNSQCRGYCNGCFRLLFPPE